MSTMPDTHLPFGFDDLDSKIQVHPDNSDVVKCFVRNCQRFVHRQTSDGKGELCPDHQIFCHYSRGMPTYSYFDSRHNVIVSRELFKNRIVSHPFKFESRRLGNEKSEDALSWNVFRSLQEANLLSGVVKILIAQDYDREPDLYFWGIRVSDDSFQPWDLLIRAREHFESNLPVDRPLTEPDIALHLPGKYLLLIEAKFTSNNPSYRRDKLKRKDNKSLTFDELLAIYDFPSMRLLEAALANQQDHIHYQLWRNTVFADWMALNDSPNTLPFHVNLVRDGFETESATEFARLLAEGASGAFRRSTWEDIYRWLKDDKLHQPLTKYFERKSANLRICFRTSKRM